MSPHASHRRLPGFRLLASGLAILGLLLAVLIVLTALNVRSLFETERFARHTSDVLSELNATFSAIQEAETGQRGYLLTGRSEYLDPYRAAIATVGTRLKTLDAIIELPENRPRVRRLVELVRATLSELDETIDLHDRLGADAALAVVETGHGQRLMQEIRQLIRDIDVSTRERLAERTRYFADTARATEATLIAGSVLLFALLIFFTMLVRRQLETRVRAEAEIREAHRNTERALKLRDSFLSTAGHEFRTPLAALSLTLQNVARKAKRDADAGLTASLEAPMRQVARLVALTDTLLDVGRIESGRLRLEREPTDLAALAREVADRLRQSSEEARSPLTVHADGPVVGDWDRLRLDQVLTNLLTNAIKFGAGAPIDVSVSATDGLAALEVRDHGIGVRSEDRSRIFERFERAVSDRSYKGMGLGLWITSQIVEAHGGTIRVESVEPGSGTTFRVDLPRTQRGETP